MTLSSRSLNGILFNDVVSEGLDMAGLVMARVSTDPLALPLGGSAATLSSPIFEDGNRRVAEREIAFGIGYEDAKMRFLNFPLLFC